MKIAFTLCSNNYLAQAKILGDSIKSLNPDYQFYIGLVDQLNTEIDYKSEIGYPIILSNEIGIQDFDTLWKKYSIIELNTCVKPFYFEYLIKNYSPLEYLFYFDPDILIFKNLFSIESEFDKYAEILLTPHVLTPIELDNKLPGENIFLNYGIFNLGFLGTKNPALSNPLFRWWKERTYHLGYDQATNGLFVDQLWFNLVPIFFKNVKISMNPGLNMAPWNLHERNLTEDNALLFKNQSFPLVFYHFSNFKYSEPEFLCSLYNRYNFDSNSYLKNIYKNYYDLLIINGIQKLSKIPFHYQGLREKHIEEEYRKKLTSSRVLMVKHYLKKIIPPVGLRILRAIRN